MTVVANESVEEKGTPQVHLPSRTECFVLNWGGLRIVKPLTTFLDSLMTQAYFEIGPVFMSLYFPCECELSF